MNEVGELEALSGADSYSRTLTHRDVENYVIQEENEHIRGGLVRVALKALAEKISMAPIEADGDWFHKAIYDLEDEIGMEPKAMFETLYKALIGKSSGPRAGWFLQVLPREWLIKRLRLEA